MAFAPGCFLWPSFCRSLPCSQLCRISENVKFDLLPRGAGGPLGKFDIARLDGHFGRRGLQEIVVLGWHFKEIFVRT